LAGAGPILFVAARVARSLPGLNTVAPRFAAIAGVGVEVARELIELELRCDGQRDP
jgi:hypothetical protein